MLSNINTGDVFMLVTITWEMSLTVSTMSMSETITHNLN